MKKILSKIIERNKASSKFEWDNRKYFIPLYLRILVLILLVVVAVYYKTSIAICNDWNGTLKEVDDSFYKLNCIPNYKFHSDHVLSFDFPIN